MTTEGFVVESTVRSWEAFIAVPFLCLWTFMFLRAMLQLHQTFELGLPFPWPALALWMFVTSHCALQCFDSVRVTRCGDELEIFTGIGPIGWYRKCRWSEILQVREGTTRANWGRRASRCIVLDGSKRVAFGSLLAANRRCFMLNVLRKMLANQ